MSNIIYDCRWSTDLNEKFISDFCQVEQEVFHNNYSRAYFDHKFVDNIYGPSVLEVVYIDEAPSAARALWRNDIDGREAYQPGDTCVLEVCRGKGVFTEMTMLSIALLPESAIVYNFPNHHSYPGYIKMGWNLLHEYGVRVFTVNRYLSEHPKMMDDEYAQWWAKGCGTLLYYIKRKNLYFLVRKDRRPFMMHVVARVNENVAKSFPQAPFGILFYPSEKNTFYNRRFLKSHIVCKNSSIHYIPTWKIDAL